MLTPQKLNLEIDQFIEQAKTFDIGIVASFGQIISSKILETANFGFINWHPSLLPKYRGAKPLQTALNNGDSQVGLSWIQMTKQMDAGDILLQTSQKVLPVDNFETLINYLGILGSRTWAIAIFVNILNRIKPKDNDDTDNTVNYTKLISVKQNEDQITICQMLQKDDKFVDSNILEANQIQNHYRAYLQFPGTSLMDKLFDGEIKLLAIGRTFDHEQLQNMLQDATNQQTNHEWTKFRINNQSVVVRRCGNNTYLEIFKIGLSNGKQLELKGFQFV